MMNGIPKEDVDMEVPETNGGNERSNDLDRIDEAIAFVRDIADGALSLSPGDLRNALDDAMGHLWRGFAPHEEAERRLAAALGGRVPEVVRLGHRQVHRRLALLAEDLRSADGPDWTRRTVRQLDALEALVSAQLELERWMLQHQAATEEGTGTHCEWCGAEYPVPPE
jgi:hypothetical protein